MVQRSAIVEHHRVGSWARREQRQHVLPRQLTHKRHRLGLASLLWGRDEASTTLRAPLTVEHRRVEDAAAVLRLLEHDNLPLGRRGDAKHERRHEQGSVTVITTPEALTPPVGQVRGRRLRVDGEPLLLSHGGGGDAANRLGADQKVHRRAAQRLHRLQRVERRLGDRDQVLDLEARRRRQHKAVAVHGRVAQVEVQRLQRRQHVRLRDGWFHLRRRAHLHHLRHLRRRLDLQPRQRDRVALAVWQPHGQLVRRLLRRSSSRQRHLLRHHAGVDDANEATRLEHEA